MRRISSHPYTPAIIFTPIASYCFVSAMSNESISWPVIVALVCGGLVTWTLAEYVIHRAVFHYEPRSVIGVGLHDLFHGRHHDRPNDLRHVVMSPAVSLPLAALFYLLFRLVMGPLHAAPFFAGFAVGYLLYDGVHYLIHSKAPRRGSGPLGWLGRRHLRHHFGDDSLGFGVTSPLWDYVFGTKVPTGSTPVSTRRSP